MIFFRLIKKYVRRFTSKWKRAEVITGEVVNGIIVEPEDMIGDQIVLRLELQGQEFKDGETFSINWIVTFDQYGDITDSKSLELPCGDL